MRRLKDAFRSLGVAAAIAMTAANVAAAQLTVILVRHAEKAAAPAADPPLTAEGETRARDLWEAVKDAGISAVITTQYTRTVATGKPTAAALHVVPEVVNASGAAHAQNVAAAARKHAGHTVLVVGHSNTIPDIIAALGAKRPPAICDSEYDNLYIVTIAADGTAGLIRSKFGVRTPPTPACAGM